MTDSPGINLLNGVQVQPACTHPDLPQTSFFTSALRPRPPKVRAIPPVEATLWEETIGGCYVETVLEYP